MSHAHRLPSLRACRTLSALALALVTALTVQQLQARVKAQTVPPPSDLEYFKNFFVTGDYVVTGVGLKGLGVNGLASGTLVLPAAANGGVPAGADLVAAFLYWNAVTKSDTVGDTGSIGATFNGHPLGGAEFGPFAKPLGAGTAPCWSSGGGTGSANGSTRTYTYRVDVLRFFDIDPNTGKFRATGAYPVQIPDTDSVTALGASLVLVYRDSSKPLRAIVLYDGDHTMDQSTQSMTTTIRGFYQASETSPQARVTHVTVSGQANKSERLTAKIGDTPVLLDGAAEVLNPFQSFQGQSLDVRTFTLTGPALAGASQLTTTVDRVGINSFDCLNWGVVIFSTTVQDSDEDGLLDVWETANVDAPLYDPHGRMLPPLGSMDADPTVRDVFLEIGYTKTDAALYYGDVLKPAHTHLPSPEVLKLVGDAFALAPALPKPGAKASIRMHFDVGTDYWSKWPTSVVTRYDKPVAQGGIREYLVPAGETDPPGLARGGDAIDETITVCQREPGDAPWVCQYQNYPGTIGWKTGFKLLRDQVLSGPEWPAGTEDPCEAPGSTCERRFDRTRKDIFRYALFAHHIGIPKATMPCLDALGAPAEAVEGSCAVAENPDFRVPRTNTGVGDFPGGDLMVTLGAFKDASGLPIGTPFMQASTLMHELGHAFERRHGGGPFEPNCKPTYLSVMNYLYQLRGLLDDFGRPHLGFSAVAGNTVNESSPSTTLSGFSYRLGWYAPLIGSVFENRSTPAGKHCDGSPIGEGERPMVRVDARRAADPIDWDADGHAGLRPSYEYTDEDGLPLSEPLLPLDVNFDGEVNSLTSSNDWAAVMVNQTGARRNTGGVYFDRDGNLALGPLSVSTGRGDLGRGDLGRGDLGRGDLGAIDLGRGDLGRGDLGRGDLGRGDLGRGDLGRGDLGAHLGRGDLGVLTLGRGDLGRGDLGGGDLGDPESSQGEIDYELARDLAKTPPIEFQACVMTSATECDSNVPANRALPNYVRTRWESPNVGGVKEYVVYRVAGGELTYQGDWVQVGTPVAHVEGQTHYELFEPADALTHDGSYTYFAVAVYTDETDPAKLIASDPSNLVTITAANTQPVLAQAPVDATIEANMTYTKSFTVRDEFAANVVVTTQSSNTTLVPAANITVEYGPASPGGDFESRSLKLTVTPATNQSGSATITVTLTDAAGYFTTYTFVLTVKPLEYTFFGVQMPSPTKSFKAGSVVPMAWQFRYGTVAVDSSFVSHTVKVFGPLENNPNERTITNTFPGNSSFRYDAATKTWYFNLQTKDLSGASYPVGTYRVTIDASPANFLDPAPFQIKLVK